MSELVEKINESLKVIRKNSNAEYKIGIVLGTGLGGLVSEIEIEHEINYEEIPHFPLSTVESHSGRLILGKIGNIIPRPVVTSNDTDARKNILLRYFSIQYF